MYSVGDWLMIYSVISSVGINHKPIDFHCKFHHFGPLFQNCKSILCSWTRSESGLKVPPPHKYVCNFRLVLSRGQRKGIHTFCYRQHCSSKGHPLPKIDHFKLMDQEVSQVACGAKEAIHIPKLRLRTQQKMLAK